MDVGAIRHGRSKDLRYISHAETVWLKPDTTYDLAAPPSTRPETSCGREPLEPQTRFPAACIWSSSQLVIWSLICRFISSVSINVQITK